MGAPLCRSTGCVHTPGTQTENRPARGSEREEVEVSGREGRKERGRERVARRRRRKAMENDGVRATCAQACRNLRQGCSRAATAYLPAEMHVLDRRQVRGSALALALLRHAVLFIGPAELAPSSRPFHRSARPGERDARAITFACAAAAGTFSPSFSLFLSLSFFFAVFATEVR